MIEALQEQATIQEYANFERSQDQRILEVKGVFWQRVRPCFYRPLLPFQSFAAHSIVAPTSALIGGFQYALSSPEKANSLLNLLIFENPQSYNLKGLDRHERREIRRASETFVVSPVTDPDEFKTKAYPVYLSFYERTRYSFQRRRTDKSYFCKWADSLYKHPKIMVLGAYANQQLGAIGIWHFVADTLIYSTFFCDGASQRLHVTGLMLHSMREVAARSAEVKRIYVGMQKNGGRTGVDNFYITRGCTLLRKPAFLQVNPFTKLILAGMMPTRYQQLCGQFDSKADFLAHMQGAMLRPCADLPNENHKTSTKGSLHGLCL